MLSRRTNGESRKEQQMPELRSVESVRSDTKSVEVDANMSSSPARNGGAAGAGKPSGEKMELRRTKGHLAHSGNEVTRQIK
jgi:hypothetical protein